MTALAMKQRGLKPAAKIVLYWLADHHNGETGMCFPSLKTLTNECEMDVATVKRHLVSLEGLGLIERTRRFRENGSQTSTQYILRMHEPLAQNAPAPSAKCAPPLAQNDTSHNLGIINLGKEPSFSPPTGADRFSDFWAIVPRRIGKGQAEKAWRAATKKADADAIISAMQAYASERDGQDAKYTAHPATWLTGERWLDEAAPSQQDFHKLVSQALGDTNGLQPARQIDNSQSQRLFEALQTPGASGSGGVAGGDAGDGRGNKPAYPISIRPRRFGGSS